MVQGEDESTSEPKRPGTPGTEALKRLLASLVIGQLLASEAFASLAVCMPLPTFNAFGACHRHCQSRCQGGQ